MFSYIVFISCFVGVIVMYCYAEIQMGRAVKKSEADEIFEISEDIDFTDTDLTNTLYKKDE